MMNMLTKEAFAEWAEKQPANKAYSFWDAKNCACGQYAKHIGFVGDWNAYLTGFWSESNETAYQSPWTFGALAKRLRAQP